MISNTLRNFLILAITACLTIPLFGQSQISGELKDATTGEPIVGAIVRELKGTAGALSDEDGKFTFKPTLQPPFDILVTIISHDSLVFQVKSLDKPLKLELQPQDVEVEGVEIVGQSISEKTLKSPLTVESMSAMSIKETPSADFYAGLGNLKGVDLTSASIGFKVINTRGFNSTSPVRTLQIIDGVDNQSPGLNFSLGNFLGAPELDIQRVDLVQGASSAYFGPNAFNGVISMQTKDPFVHQGLSVSLKGGERALFEGAVRYAHAFKNKEGVDKFAFKVNVYYMRAHDWEATNMDPTPQSLVGTDNPGGYDAVNRYGDENITEGQNNLSDPTGQIIYPGLGIFHRRGYEEINLVNYNTRNLKGNASLHYKLSPKTEAIYSFNIGSGTTVYQGENRFSLKDILFFQNRVEIRQQDKFFFRAYSTNEDAGNSYDAVFTAFQMQNRVKDDKDFFSDYLNYWNLYINPKVKALPGWPPPPSLGNPFDLATAQQILAANHDSLVVWHQQASEYANGVGFIFSNNQPYIEPGTAAYDSIFALVTSLTSYSEGGTKFFDRSALYHAHGEYKFTPKFMDITVGGNTRLYAPNSQGTIFSDTGSSRITNFEFGIYAGVEKNFMDGRLKVNITSRLDKNQNFPFLVSPAASVVYTADARHIFRLSFSSAIRNPTLSDQYLKFNVGRATLLGNVVGYDSLITPASLNNFFQDLNPDTLEYINIPRVVPEKVKSIEIGYRGTWFKQLFIDASYYMSFYRDFLGYKFGIDGDYDPMSGLVIINNIYRIAANSDDGVTTQGFSLAANYFFAKYFAINGNYSWNVLDKRGSEDPIIPAFNTPAHKFNIGVSARDIRLKIGKFKLNDWGFNINYKWVQGFLFEGSPQFTGSVPTYGLLDGQISKTVPKIHTTFKIGASNILNKKQIQVYGGPAIGRLAYISIRLDLDDL
ncbi:MAG: TonB-dependent receptor plug domain-containing protein [Bacteroidia bacterium]|nr:TonB-dependent receptor plug domain-containing protein [Bacteroidia bacterium]